MPQSTVRERRRPISFVLLPALVAGALALAATDAGAALDIGRLAHLLGQGRSQMFERIRATAGIPPAEFLKRRRLERASEMLAARTGSVGEVAYAVGFSSVSHFSRAFRERYGCTPREWGREGTPRDG